MVDEQNPITASDIAIAIAAVMSEPWQASAGMWNHDDAFLCGPRQGERIHLMSGGRYRPTIGRVELSGSLENGLYQHMPYGEKMPSITVSRSKTPQQIARDIERRLLPEFRRIRNLVLERKARADEAELARKQLVEKLATAFGVENRDGMLWIGSYDEPLNGDIEVRSATYHVEFKLRVSPALAVKLAEAIVSVRQANMPEGEES